MSGPVKMQNLVKSTTKSTTTALEERNRAVKGAEGERFLKPNETA